MFFSLLPTPPASTERDPALMGSSMSRQAPQSITIDQEQLGTIGEAKIQSDAETKAQPHPIFLSHSGHDKPFVKKLYDALRSAGHDPFFDTHSLPAGEPFPAHIFQNASGCRLGVLVLSPSFLTSRWPMMELHCMHTSLSAPTILPLFFKVSPNDVKLSSPRISEWRGAWQMLAKQFPSRVNPKEWEAAITNLSNLNGVVYNPDEGEDAFIEKALRYICSIVRPLLRYMVSHLTGCERLTQEVATMFEEIPPCSHFEAQTLGFYGIGGQGKTTICKLMVNHYAVAYAGRCTLIEFPTGDCQEEYVLNQCKKALQQLTNISEGRISCVDDLDQCLQLLKQQVGGLGVFIAIDNVWEKYLECAQRIVDVGFSKESKLLVTSRSGNVLISLLKDRRSVRELPSLNTDEAHQIFLNSFNRNHSGSLRIEGLDVDKMTGYFQFEHQYHPLAISALGVAWGKTDGRGWPATWDKMHQFFWSSDNPVAKAIRINYDSIPKIRRELFLDVVLIYIPTMQCRYGSTQTGISIVAERNGCSRVDENFDRLHTWLSALYKGRMDEWEVTRNLMQLTYDGLLEFDDCFGLARQVRVHDLYKDLAIQEGAASGNFFVGNENFKEKDIKYGEVERIVVKGGHNLLKGERVPSLQLLRVEKYGYCRGLRLDLMPELRILNLQNDYDHPRDLMDLQNTPHLAWLELQCVKCENFSENSDLLVLKLEECWVSCRQLYLNGLVNLQVLVLHQVCDIDEIMGLGSLINLKSMSLHEQLCLRKVGKFSRHMTQLQVLEIYECDLLEDLEGLGLLPNLKALRCAQDWLCKEPLMFTKALQALKLHKVREAEITNLRDMVALEYLCLKFQWGGRSIGRIRGLSGSWVEEINSISQMPSLETFEIVRCFRLKEMEWSSFHDLSNLKRIEIRDCPSLKNVKGDPRGIASPLPRLVITLCKNLEEIAGLHLFNVTFSTDETIY